MGNHGNSKMYAWSHMIFFLRIIFYLNKGHYYVHAVLNLALSLPPPTYTHTHTHTHTVIFSLKKRKSHSCTQAFEEWCLGKTTRETEHVPCVFAQCMHVCSVVSNSTTEKIFFKKSNSRDFSDGPGIKRLSLPMKGSRDQSLVRECHVPWGQKPKT